MQKQQSIMVMRKNGRSLDARRTSGKVPGMEQHFMPDYRKACQGHEYVDEAWTRTGSHREPVAPLL